MLLAERIVAAVEAALRENSTRSTPEHNAACDHERLVCAVEKALVQPSGNPGEFERIAERAAWLIDGCSHAMRPTILRAIIGATAGQADEIDRLNERLESLSVQLSDELVDRQRQAARIAELDHEVELLKAGARDSAEKLAAWKHHQQLDDRQIEQTLGKALHYPAFRDDPANFPTVAQDDDSVCVGDHVPGSLAAEAAKRITELEYALQGRTMSCVCGGEGKQEDLRRALAALAGAVDDVIKETASEFLRTMVAPPWYRRLYAAREAVNAALEGK